MLAETKHKKQCPLCKGKGKVNPFALKPSDERFLEAAKIFLKYKDKEQQKNLFRRVAKHLEVSQRTAERYYTRLKK
jgi:hypothetical protein